MGDQSRAQLWLQSRHRLGESILWHEVRQRFFWIDLLEPALWSCDASGGGLQSRELPIPPPIGSIAATTNPRHLMLAHRSGLSLLDIDTLALEAWCDPEQGRDGIIFNDMKCDRWGRLWVGTSHEREREPRGALWCVKDRHTWQLADVGFPIANGPAFSPDGTAMYFNDSANHQTLTYDVRPTDLRATNRRVLASYSVEEGMPDGLTVDADGCIWTAQWGGASVIRLTTEGEKRERHPIPAANITSLCFAGSGSSTLLITSARDGLQAEALLARPLTGSLFTLDVQTKGLAETLFPIDL